MRSLAAVEDTELGEDFVCAVSRDLLATALPLADETEVRDALGLAPSARVTLDGWIEYTTEWLLPSLLDDADMSLPRSHSSSGEPAHASRGTSSDGAHCYVLEGSRARA